MIPSQSSIINRKILEQQITALEAVINLKQRRIRCLEQRSLREREWIVALTVRTIVTPLVEPTHNAQRYTAQLYTEALRDYYDSEVQIMKVDLMQTEMELNIKKAMLQDGLSNLVKPQ